MVTRLLPVLALLACSGGPSASPALTPEAWVVRASLDLRGVRPTVGEIRRVHDDPASAASVVRGFVQDDRFGDRLADLYAELYLTRTDLWPFGPAQFGLSDREVSNAAFVRALGDEVPQMIARIAREDLPWTELVLGDWTMADEVLARVHPVERTPGEGWQVARYTDDRPAAGVLSTNGLWWRYGSTASNGNRGRAAQVSRLLRCVDYAEVQVPFDADLDLLDEEAVSAAIREDAACAACHDRLDPLAGYLYGFWYVDDTNPLDVARYHPERETLWREFSGQAPALDGRAGFDLRDLGRQIAADEAFPDCAVEQAFRMVLRRPPGSDDEAARVTIRNAFLEGGLTARALYEALVLSEPYRSNGDDGVGLRMATPELMASQVEDLTGYRLVHPEGWDLLEADLVGLRGLAGGADGTTSTRHADEPNATVVLVQARLAELAAAHVVAHDADTGLRERRLLRQTTFDEAPGDPAVARQIAALQVRIFGRDVQPDDPEVEAYVALWDDLHGIDGQATTAWTGVVTALLRDPDLLLY